QFRWPGWALAAGGGLALLGCLVLSWVQVQYWQTPLAMWSHTLEVDPQSYMAQGNVGQLIGDMDIRRSEEAAEYFRRAIALEPNYDFAYLNLGIVLQRLKRWDEAAKYLEMATRIDPESQRAAHAHNRLGQMALMRGNLAVAVNHLSATVRIAPGFA